MSTPNKYYQHILQQPTEGIINSRAWSKFKDLKVEE